MASHDGHSGGHGHLAALDLVRHADATHRAVRNGAWNDPATWMDGEIPGDGARVVIEAGVAVGYAIQSDARLQTVRVDGTLDFATDADSRMVVDTMVVSKDGHLKVGTAENPVQTGTTVDIVIADNGDIDVTQDVEMLGRGIVSMGEVDMHGARKATHLKVDDAPMAGDTSITLAEVPAGWAVGDTIVIAGTRNEGYKWGTEDGVNYGTVYYGSQDEVVTITSIDGATVAFDTPLVHDHDAPRDDLKTSVANYTRNISIESENGGAAETHHRGHVMFMNDAVDVRYVEFHELGRTDKASDSMNAGMFPDLSADSNVKGRYPLHFHRTGLDDVENPAMAVGNAVFGSPGWGITHHDANAVLHDNATFDTFGAGFVAETGNEIGSWSSNIAISAQGRSWGSPKNVNDPGAFDIARAGSGFYFQGRMVDTVDNVAAGVNSGFTYFHRGRPTDPGDGADSPLRFDAALFDLPEALQLDPLADYTAPPILHFDGNETFASNYGVFVEKASPDQRHDVRTVLSDFTAWEVRQGGHFAYTSHYLLKDFDVVGKVPTLYSDPLYGIEIGTNASDFTVVDTTIDGFGTGIRISDRFNQPGASIDQKQHFVTGVEITDVDRRISEVDPRVFQEVARDAIIERDGIVLQHDGPLMWRPNIAYGPAVEVTPTKTDSQGTIALPAGTDANHADRAEVVRILETDGYRTTADGRSVFILEDYYSDRLTGEIFKDAQLVEIPESQIRFFNNRYHSLYEDVVYAGGIDLDSAAPVTGNETVQVRGSGDVVIDLLANDRDPEGDTLSLDGITQPHRGAIFDNGDGTVTYRPALGDAVEETVKYWVTDGNGNFSEAWLTVVTDGAGTLPRQPTLPQQTAPQPAAPDTALPNSDLVIDGTAGVLIGAVNKWSVTGQELGLRDADGPANAYHVTAASGGANYASVHAYGVDEGVARGVTFHTDVERIVATSFKDVFFGRGSAIDLDMGAGNDIVSASRGDDRIAGGEGNDTLIGAGGANVFVFAPNGGDDRIRDFAVGVDRLDVSAFGAGPDRLPEWQDAGGDTDVTFADGSSVLLRGVDAQSLTIGDFIL